MNLAFLLSPDRLIDCFSERRAEETRQYVDKTWQRTSMIKEIKGLMPQYIW